jgi:hypothetical protein
MIYFVPEAREQYAELGITHHRMGYFASRSAAMGAVSPEVVIATFFNFNPVLIHKSIPQAWSIAPPGKVIAARFAGADRALRRAFGDAIGSPELVELAALTRRAAMVAGETPEGRPLFAAHAALAWPDEPHLVLWHAQTLLREFRGDAHVALLCTAGLSAVEALVIHGATGAVPPAALQTSRAWPDDAWAEGVESVRAPGWLGDDGALTSSGRAHREQLEAETDALASRAYVQLGADDSERVVQLGRTFSRMIVDGGLLPFDSPTARRGL